jgi:hypothetical protein
VKHAALKPFKRIAIRKRITFVDVLYGEKVGDPRPFILTVSSLYVSRKTSQSLPISVLMGTTEGVVLDPRYEARPYRRTKEAGSGDDRKGARGY